MAKKKKHRTPAPAERASEEEMEQVTEEAAAAASVEAEDIDGNQEKGEVEAGEGDEEADLSMCDASFRAEDAVSTSGHETVSRCTESKERFLLAIQAHQDRSQDFDFEESLGTLTQDEVTALWASLDSYLASSGPGEVETLAGVLLVARLSAELETVTQDCCPPGLQAAAARLHTLLPRLRDTKIQNNICHLLETWYTRNLPDRDGVIINALTWLLRKSLGPQGAKADVRRIWSLHPTLLEQRIPEDGPLHRLLVATVGTGMFLTTPEGVRWLVSLFRLSPDLVLRLHKQARGCLPSLSKAACLGLGEVYHKSWLAAGGEFKTRLETDCVQDLMYRGVLASRARGGVAAPVARVLSYFRSQERSQPTQNLLARLFEPILWRHLKVANQEVRLNACELFLAHYPLEDHDLTREERDTSLEMQHRYMLTLLRDEDAKVRAEAVTGVCRALGSYWQLIPSETINQVVRIMWKELAWDSAAPRVRMNTIHGVSALLAAPQSHVYLKALLPKLGDCLHDTNEAVRSAVLDLLNTVKGLRSIKFWNICTVENLLARLETDKAYLCRRISKLLFNSYFPSGQGEEVKLERAIHMINMNRRASRRFYQYAAESLDVEAAMVFMLNILTSVKVWIKSKSAASEPVQEGEDKENQGRRRRKLYSSSDSSVMSEEETTAESSANNTTALANNTTAGAAAAAEEGEEAEEHPYDDSAVVAGVLDIVCVIWRARIADISKPENNEMRSALEKKAGKWMLIFFKYFKATPVISTVVYFSSYLPERAVAPVASYCLARVKEDDAWKTHVDSLCNWRKGDSLLEIVVEGIRSILQQQEARPAASKGVRFEETVSKDCQVKVALRLVKYLLGQQANRAILMAKNRDMMEELLTTCAGVQDYITRRLSFKDTSGTSPADVAEIVSVWAQLSLLLHPDTAAAWSQELLAWSEREVLAAVDTQQQGEAGPRTRDQVSLATQVLAALATAAMSGLVLGLANTADHAAKCVEWAGQLTQCGGAPFLTSHLELLTVTAETAAHRGTADWAEVLEDHVPVSFAGLLKWLAFMGGFQQLEQEDEDVGKFKQGLSTLFKVFNNKGKSKESFEDLIDTTVAAVIAIIAKKVDEEDEVLLENQGKVVNTMTETMVKVAGANFVGAALERYLEEFKPEDADESAEIPKLPSPKLAACLNMTALVKSDNKAVVVELIENIAKKELEVEEDNEEENNSERDFLKQVQMVASDMK